MIENAGLRSEPTLFSSRFHSSPCFSCISEEAIEIRCLFEEVRQAGKKRKNPQILHVWSRESGGVKGMCKACKAQPWGLFNLNWALSWHLVGQT